MHSFSFVFHFKTLPFFLASGICLTAFQAVAEQPPLTVYLVRHGEAFSNLPAEQQPEGKDLDVLTEKGKQQATTTGNALRGQEIARVFASPTGRTRETADLILNQLEVGGEVVAHEAFRPMDAGVPPTPWSWREEHWARGEDPVPIDGESLGQSLERTIKALKEIAEERGGQSIAVVTHSDIWAGLVAKSRGTSLTDAYKRHKPKFAEVVQLKVRSDSGVVPQPE